MIHIVLGTKAQLIKMAPVMVGLKRRSIPYNFVFTGQHRETIEEMLQEFSLRPPNVVLYEGRDVVSLPQAFVWASRVMAKTLIRRRSVFGGDRHGIVLVHGDTLSTLLGACMGKLARLEVGHVEAGLRSHRLRDPFPEEVTRILVSRISDVLYCPGSWAMDNVRHLKGRKVDTRANTLMDTLDLAMKMRRGTGHVPEGPFGIASIHRYENVFRRTTLESIVETLKKIADDRRLLFVLHPSTERQLRRFDLLSALRTHPRLELRPRYTYFDFVSLLLHADYVVTDGGSIQEEASYLGIPCLLLRRATERREGIGTNVVLSDFDPDVIAEFIENPARFRCSPMVGALSPTEKIIEDARGFA